MSKTEITGDVKDYILPSTNHNDESAKERYDKLVTKALAKNRSKQFDTSQSDEQSESCEQMEQTEFAEPTQQTVSSNLTTNAQPKRTSPKQRKASLDEYRELFMRTPKITDRQPVFVSREVRDRIDEIVRRLGERKMSVSGFLENLAKQHLDSYAEELEQWKRL